MKEVSKEEFHRVIGPKDVHPQVVPPTYKSLFKTPGGQVKGITEVDPLTFKIIKYYLP